MVAGVGGEPCSGGATRREGRVRERLTLDHVLSEACITNIVGYIPRSLHCCTSGGPL